MYGTFTLLACYVAQNVDVSTLQFLDILFPSVVVQDKKLILASTKIILYYQLVAIMLYIFS